MCWHKDLHFDRPSYLNATNICLSEINCECVIPDNRAAIVQEQFSMGSFSLHSNQRAFSQKYFIISVTVENNLHWILKIMFDYDIWLSLIHRSMAQIHETF